MDSTFFWRCCKCLERLASQRGRLWVHG